MNELDRPSWDNYLMGMAFQASTRSPDANTKHGCVIVNKENRVIATGFNGFPAGLDDINLPNSRPPSNYEELSDEGKTKFNKYLYMRHSEHNAAILASNSTLEPFKAVITGQVCPNCLFDLGDIGIKSLVMLAGRSYNEFNGTDNYIFENYCKEKNITYKYIEFDYYNYLQRYLKIEF